MLQFKKVKPATRRAKVLLLGEPGVGKTHAALTFPRPAVIDAEGSVDWFADRFDIVAVPTKSFKEVGEIIAEARTKGLFGEGDKTPRETLVIDSLTSIYNSLVAQRGRGKERLAPEDHGVIKRNFSQMLDELYHKVPSHVVCIGWIKPEYAKPGTVVDGEKVRPNQLVSVGEQFDGDKKAAHAFDFIFKIEGNAKKKTRATVIKSRSAGLVSGQQIDDFSFATIAPLLGEGDNGYRGMTDEEQILTDEGIAHIAKPDAQPAAETPPLSNAQLKALFAEMRIPGGIKSWIIANVKPDYGTDPTLTDLERRAAEKFMRAYVPAAVDDDGIVPPPEVAAQIAAATPATVGAKPDGNPPKATAPEMMTDTQRAQLQAIVADMGWDDADVAALIDEQFPGVALVDLSAHQALRVLDDALAKQRFYHQSAADYQQGTLV